MTKLKTIALLVVAVTAVSCWQSSLQTPQARIKIENDGGIVNGANYPAATAMPYDPYFIHVNDIPHLQISDARTTLK